MQKPTGTAWTLALKWSRDYGIYDLHGLWEQKKIWRSSGQSERVELPDDLLLKMEQYWNSDLHQPVRDVSQERRKEILLRADKRFWQHQWDKHGQHSGLKMVDYFWKAIEQYEKRKDTLPVVDEHHQLHWYLDEEFQTLGTDLVCSS